MHTMHVRFFQFLRSAVVELIMFVPVCACLTIVITQLMASCMFYDMITLCHYVMISLLYDGMLHNNITLNYDVICYDISLHYDVMTSLHYDIWTWLCYIVMS